MRCSKNEEGLSDLVLISMNKGLLQKIKVEHSADTFYNEVINDFTKKKQRTELIYK